MACGKTVLCLGVSLMKDYWPNSPAEFNNIIINQAAVVTYQILFIACLDLFLWSRYMLLFIYHYKNTCVVI